MKTIQDLLRRVTTLQIIGEVQEKISKVVFDSRKVKKGDLFVAVKGTQSDGHLFIDNVIKKGAVGIVLEQLPKVLSHTTTYILVKDSAEVLGQIAAAFYDWPSEEFKLVGITGTNGKTTTATLLHGLFTSLGYKVGLTSTIENKIGEKVVPAHYTTPDAVALNSGLREMIDAGCSFGFMEVSSHAIEQRRIAGIKFSGGVFTNITHEHLDYHKTFAAYIKAKQRFFDELPQNAFALTNADDRRGNVMVQNTKAGIFRYSLYKMVDFKGKILENSLHNLHLDINGHDFFARLIGEFNAYNLLTVFAVASLLDQDEQEVLTALSNAKPAEGRFEIIVGKEITGIVDYAHTPDALEKVLKTIKKLKVETVKVITVVGCGGDRDKIKRPKMAKIACEWSDTVVLTSDNPRTEDPQVIIEEMEKGIPQNGKRKTLSILNRKEAIKTACRLAGEGDILLIAGKGHEKYQEINGKRYPFDDKAILKEELR
ncbi:MAG: UDP-N-acetylmuramoyl-L-alanyl-D-glutamate--2,6-diaminopimelate ligase [Bacteroidetes bacterium]|nr:UDP-N-acetylmuramoyl-L-alanyl-D-glutamate--2,6-diaminopimelate ligase [Bacteroidota bacterium]